MLLGYGKTNVWLFWERTQGKNVVLSSIWDEEIEKRMLEGLLLPVSFCSDHREISSRLFYPTFAGDPASMETAQLKYEYQSTRRKIIQYYQGKDFLESTLYLLKKWR